MPFIRTAGRTNTGGIGDTGVALPPSSTAQAWAGAALGGGGGAEFMGPCGSPHTAVTSAFDGIIFLPESPLVITTGPNPRAQGRACPSATTRDTGRTAGAPPWCCPHPETVPLAGSSHRGQASGNERRGPVPRKPVSLDRV